HNQCHLPIIHTLYLFPPTTPRPPRSTLFPYTTLFRSWATKQANSREPTSVIWVQLGCNKTSEQLLRAPKVAIGAVKLQLVTSGRWIVTAVSGVARQRKEHEDTARNAL